MELDAQRLDVRSADGTPIAVWAGGTGRPIVMVHGSIADHTTFDAFVPALRAYFTTFCIDRRGFGDSGDSPPYALERDFDDVRVALHAVAARTGRPVVLFGHSYGANCALGAVADTDQVSHLVLYEPSFGLRYPTGVIEDIEEAIAAEDRDGAIDIVLTTILELTPEEIAEFRASPLWPRRLKAAATIPRECRVEESWVPSPGLFGAITVPTLLLSGADSTPELIAATERVRSWLPDSRLNVLPGHGHFAHRDDPELVARLIRDFAEAS